jgi:DNA-binding response OmpR family regulator
MGNALRMDHMNSQPNEPVPAVAAAGSTSRRYVVLLVDDGDDTRILTKWFLGNFGYAVDTARTAEEGLLLFDPKIHDIIVTDNSMPGMSGVEMAHVVKMRSPSTPVLMYTGRIPPCRSCVDLVIQRPAHLLALKQAIEQLLAPQ